MIIDLKEAATNKNGAEISDNQLMRQYCEGNARAFDQLYLRHKAGLYRYLYRQCRNTNLVEEMFQDTWMRLVDKRDQFQTRQGSSFTAYLYRIAHNRLVDYFRRATLEQNAFAQQDDEQLQNYAAPLTEVTEHIHQHRQLDQLLQSLDTLPAEQREAFLLHEEGGLTLAEIAELTQVPRETVKSRLRYALARLRKALSDTAPETRNGTLNITSGETK